LKKNVDGEIIIFTKEEILFGGPTCHLIFPFLCMVVVLFGKKIKMFFEEKFLKAWEKWKTTRYM
jgi:hypothetical protein